MAFTADEQRRRHQQRQYDAARICPAAGTFDIGGFFKVLGDRLQSGEVEDHEESRLFPDGHDDDRPKSSFRLA